jgi:hypothetical protein
MNLPNSLKRHYPTTDAHADRTPHKQAAEQGCRGYLLFHSSNITAQQYLDIH